MDTTKISLVRTTYKAVTAVDGGQQQLIRSFYANLFAHYPEVRKLFPAVMNAQRDRMLEAVGYVVRNLDDTDRIIPFLAQLGRDHRKYGVTDDHYIAAGNALLAAMESFAGTELWTQEAEIAWSEAVVLIVTAMVEGGHADPGPATRVGRVVEHKQVLRDVAVVRLQLDQPLRYGAGQYVSVSVPDRPQMWRYLSPSIPSNDEGQIEFHIRRVSGGWVSPAMVGETRSNSALIASCCDITARATTFEVSRPSFATARS